MREKRIISLFTYGLNYHTSNAAVISDGRILIAIEKDLMKSRTQKEHSVFDNKRCLDFSD